MRKGAIPVPYIIALILGIVVVGLLAYWFFILGGRIPGQATEAECRAKQNIYCTEWLATGYNSTLKPNGEYFSRSCPAGGTYAPECCSYSWASAMSSNTAARSACQSLLG